MLHEFLSSVTDDLLSATKAETEEDIKYEDIVTVVTNKLNSCGVDCDDEYGKKLTDMISLILYRIITKDMEIPSNCEEGPNIEKYPGDLVYDIALMGNTLYAHWRQLPLDAQDVKLIKKYLYRGRTVEEGSYLDEPMEGNFSFYTGNLGIVYEYDPRGGALDRLVEDIVVYDPGTNVDDRGVLTVNLNRTIFYAAVHYKSLIIKDIQLQYFARAIWRKLFKEAVKNRFKSKITAIRINPCKIYSWGATQKFIEDNFSIKIGGQSYTISEFIDALTAEFTKLLTSSKSSVIANKHNLTQGKTLR